MFTAEKTNNKIPAKPSWLKIKLPKGENYLKVKNIVHKNSLSTICQSGHCPNMGECWDLGTATFMILGNICTRNCTFCNVNSGTPIEPDTQEPMRIAEAVQLMQLKHCVVTSVTRDDLEDKGSMIWSMTIRKIKELNPGTTIEVLIPDMKDDLTAIKRIFNEKPDIISHNMETVERLYKTVRPQANYQRSLHQIRISNESGHTTKSGFMVGIGEADNEVFELIMHLKESGLDILTIGQYLQPSKEHHPVIEYIRPEKFELYKIFALENGINTVVSSPLVRSSYHSEQHLLKNELTDNLL